MSPTKLRVHSK